MRVSVTGTNEKGLSCLSCYVLLQKNPWNKNFGLCHVSPVSLSFPLSSSEMSHRGAGAALRPLGARRLELDPCASLQ